MAKQIGNYLIESEQEILVSNGIRNGKPRLRKEIEVFAVCSTCSNARTTTLRELLRNPICIHKESLFLNKKFPKEYSSWSAMKNRCTNPKCDFFYCYGGQGISFCERWNSFQNFLTDMGPRPKETSLDRIDVNGNYEPGNCKWSTPKEQRANRRDSK